MFRLGFWLSTGYDGTTGDQAPSITSGATASVAENVSTGATVYTITATDPDVGQTLTYSLGGGVDDALFNVNASTGVITFKSSPNFEAPADANADNVYSIVVRASDGTIAVTKAVAITVSNVNEAPSITSSNAFSVAENSSAVATLTATDPDAATTLAWSIIGGADQSKFSINSSTGALSFQSAPNYEVPTDANTDNIYVVQVQVSDGSLTATQTINVTVTNVNEAPTITSSNAFSVAENGTAVATLTATDPDAGTVFTWSIVGGADQAKFSINSSTGALAFQSPPDYDIPGDANADNVYVVQVRVTDGTNPVTQTINVTVTNVNEAPVISSNGAGATASITVNENQTAVTTVAASDPDAGASLTYSISGGADSALFSINSSTGVLVFQSAPDYENRLDADLNGIYEVIVQVSDGTLTDTQAISVTVANVNEAPTSIILTSSELQDNATNGTLIGHLIPAGEGSSFTFALISDPSNKLSITGDQLLVAGSLSGLTTYAFSVRVTDANSLTFTQSLTLTIHPTAVSNPSGVGTGDGTVTTPDPADPAADQDGFVTVPIAADTSGGLKLTGKNGGSATFLMDLGAPVNGRSYIMQYTPDWSAMSQLGRRAAVGFAFKSGNNFHLVALRGNGSSPTTTMLDSRISGDFRKANQFGITSDGNAAHGTKDGPNWLKLDVASDGTTYTLSSSADGVSWTAEETTRAPSPLTHVSDAVQFGPAGYFSHSDSGPFSIVINIFSGFKNPVNTVAPVISGTTQVGQTLSVTNGTWNAEGGTIAYTYQWKRGGVNISSATASTYALVSADNGATITCTVTATNQAGPTSATSAGVGPITQTRQVAGPGSFANMTGSKQYAIPGGFINES